MDRTQRTIAELRKWISQNPNEIETLREYIKEIADNLDNGTYGLIDMSRVIKLWKRPHGQQVFEIFRQSYQNALQQEG